MEEINLQCNKLSQTHLSVLFRLKILRMTGRVYIGEVLNQVWLKSVKK